MTRTRMNKLVAMFLAILMTLALGAYVPMNKVKAASQADALVSVALAEEGYTEGSNNDNKYGAYFGNNHVAWCAYFISWCARQAGIPESVIKTNAWAGSMGSSKRTGNFGGQYYPKGSITPQKGDIVYYGWGSSTSEHVEIIISTSGNTFTSIGGNTKGSTKTEGVRRHSDYSFTSSQVVGYERPNYSNTTPSCNIKLSVNPGTDLQTTKFSWNFVPTAIKYGIRIYEADNWENQVYSNWNHTGYDDSIQLNSGNYMGQCMYLTTEGGDWIFGDMTYFSVKSTNLVLSVNPGTDLQTTKFSWNFVPTAIKYGIRIYEADNWENQVYSNWNHTGYDDSIQLNSGNYMGQCMYLTTEGGNWIFGDMTYFSIKATKLTIPDISTDKTSYVVGDTINISWNASASNSLLSHYWLVVKDLNGTEIIGETMDKNTSYSFTVDKAGEYTIITYATPLGSNSGEGSLTDTKIISVTEPIKGDINSDGEFNISDVLLLQKWILADPNAKLADWKAADLCEDGKIDVFDLCMMKRMLVAKS